MADVRYKPLHIGISVSNIEDAASWFEDVLGFTLRDKSEMTPMGFRVAFLDNGGGFEVELFENKDTKPPSEERFHPDSDSKTQGRNTSPLKSTTSTPSSRILKPKA